MLYMAFDMIGMCRFDGHLILLDPGLPKFEEISQLIRYNTGLEFSAREVWECADRAYTLERLFNLREGLTRKDDWLVDRYFDEPMPVGLNFVWGKSLDREKFKALLDEYYRYHEWDENGIPVPETLKFNGKIEAFMEMLARCRRDVGPQGGTGVGKRRELSPIITRWIT